MLWRSILTVVLLATTSLLAQKTLTATDAKAHIGRQASTLVRKQSWQPNPSELRSAVLSRSSVRARHLGK